MKHLVRIISKSSVFNHARVLHDRNLHDWNYPLTKWQKIMVGSYMILRDYAEGIFPRRFEDEQATYDGETAYYDTLQTLGNTKEELYLCEMQKPFWYGHSRDLLNYANIQSFFNQCGVNPPMRLLEVGCGSGWMAEFLACSGFSVMATTLDPSAGEMIERRKAGLIAKSLPHNLNFRPSAMEYVDHTVADLEPFDAVYVYDALHHAHDWKKTINALSQSLRSEGWCFILNEPNLIHILTSYRVAQLSNTHEIGINPSSLRRHLSKVGFGEIRILKNRNHWFIRPTWLAARKK